MSFFDYRDGILHAEDVPLPAIADAVGTPVHVYSAAALRHAAEAFRAALAPLPATRLAFAVKANPNTAVLRLLAADPQRIILFDSSPALAASPASVLAGLVGQTVLVVRADKSSDSDLREAVSLLDGCEEIQLLLNATTFRAAGARFGYYGLGRS